MLWSIVISMHENIFFTCVQLESRITWRNHIVQVLSHKSRVNKKCSSFACFKKQLLSCQICSFLLFLSLSLFIFFQEGWWNESVIRVIRKLPINLENTELHFYILFLSCQVGGEIYHCISQLLVISMLLIIKCLHGTYH